MLIYIITNINHQLKRCKLMSSLINKACCTILLALPVVSFASGYTGPGSNISGYTGPGSVTSQAGINTVAGLLAHGRDDQDVVVEGVIIRQIDKEHFIFSDGSGEIQVEIDEDDLRHLGTFNENTRLKLIGDLDKKRDGFEIEVDKVIKVD